MGELKAKEYKRFEDIKYVRDDGSEYWSARELAQALEYNKWENFHKVIKRAMIACENSGHIIVNDFPEVRKIVSAGATSKPVKDREAGEAILDTAKRELYEETGATIFDIQPICVYSVTGKNSVNEAGEEALTYPLIQPKLMEEALRRNVVKK